MSTEDGIACVADQKQESRVSEYQYIAFRAIDRPLTDQQLDFARRQSTRAQITRWSFENEYHFGDFHGDADGLLRHGYDVHLHYASFGIQSVGIRLSAGLPFPKSVWSKYTGTDSLTWNKDSKGKGGILKLHPYRDADRFDEILSPEEYMNDVMAIRERLIGGDLRALYILWLCSALDDNFELRDVIEPPVPSGLYELVGTCGDFLAFFDLDPLTLTAAAIGTPESPAQQRQELRISNWVNELDESSAKQLLRELILGETSVVKSKLLAKIGAACESLVWPSIALGRTLGEILDQTEILRAEYDNEQRQKREAAQNVKQQRQNGNGRKE